MSRWIRFPFVPPILRMMHARLTPPFDARPVWSLLPIGEVDLLRWRYLIAQTYKSSLALCILAFTNTAVRADPNSAWESAWYSSPTKYSVSFADATVQTRIVVATGGGRLRLRYSNLYGQTPLLIGAVSVLANGVRMSMTFGGAADVTVAPGRTILSDPVALNTQSGNTLTVSTYYPVQIPADITSGAYNVDRNLLFSGRVVDQDAPITSARELTSAYAISSISYFLIGVEIEADQAGGSIVVVGDSLTGGAANAWPTLFAQRLRDAGKSYNVINASVGGNRILRDSRMLNYGGESLINRFERDVLDQPNVKYVILFEGSNDIAVWRYDGVVPGAMPSAAEIIGAITKLAERAHKRGVSFYVATMTPSMGANAPEYGSPQFNAEREKINAWIRSTKLIDGYFDFARAVADPANPTRFRNDLHLGDHHHPNGAGQKAISEAIDLEKFK